jgi:hypothetical protein
MTMRAARQLFFVVDKARWWFPTSLLKIPHWLCPHYCVGDVIMPARSNSPARHDFSAMYPGVKSVVWRSDAIPQVGLDAVEWYIFICLTQRDTAWTRHRTRHFVFRSWGQSVLKQPQTAFLYLAVQVLNEGSLGFHPRMLVARRCHLLAVFSHLTLLFRGCSWFWVVSGHLLWRHETEPRALRDDVVMFGTMENEDRENGYYRSEPGIGAYRWKLAHPLKDGGARLNKE